MPKFEDIECAVEALRLEPGDIAVLATDWPLTVNQAAELRTRFKNQVGAANKVLVLTAGLKLLVLTRAEIESMAE